MFKEPAVARKTPEQIAKMRQAGRVVDHFDQTCFVFVLFGRKDSEMSRTIAPMGGFSGALSDGQVLLAPFPDLAKPLAGGWLLTVNLANDGACDVAAHVELLQDQTSIFGDVVVLKSAVFQPTATPADYSLEITEAELRGVAQPWLCTGWVA